MSTPNNTLRGWLPTVALIAGALVLYLGSALIATQLSGSTAVGAVVSNAVLFAAGLVWLRSRRHLDTAVVPVRPRGELTREPGFWALVFIALLLCWLMGQAASLWLYSLLGSPNFDGHTAAKAQAPALLILVLVLVLAPMGEEMLMRGLAYSGLRRHVRPFAAAVLTTGVFSLLHLNLVQTVLTLPLGLLLAVVYEQTGRLAPVIGLHAVFNLLSVIVPAELVAGFASLSFVLVGGSVLALLLVRLYLAAGGSGPEKKPSGSRGSGGGERPAIAG